MGPFQTQKGMSEIRHSEQVRNSEIKRKKIKGYPVGVICGCSRSCGFAYIQKHIPEKEEAEYKDWLKKHQ